MTTAMWPEHLLTLEEFTELPEDNSRRVELQEGVLIVSPRAARLHQRVLLDLVEIISPGSRATDTRVKPYEYAEAGIPHYWVVDLDEPLSLATYHLAGELGYQEAPAVTKVFETSEPFPLRIDLTELPDGPAITGRNT